MRESKKLPPELVSSMLDAVFIKRGGHESNMELSDELAKIAVNHSNEEKKELVEGLKNAIAHMKMHGLTTRVYEQLLKKDEDENTQS